MEDDEDGWDGFGGGVSAFRWMCFEYDATRAHAFEHSRAHAFEKVVS